MTDVNYTLTEREFSRSAHFTGDSREDALRRTAIYQEHIHSCIASIFNDTGACKITLTHRFDTDRAYAIRKGSAILTVNTVFGSDTSYKEKPPRKFHTFTVTARYHNEVLDKTDEAGRMIEWTCRIAGALVFGILVIVAALLARCHLTSHLLMLGFGGGLTIGGLIGELVARNISSFMEKRLEKKGEVTAVDEEWDMLTGTLSALFDTPPGD